MMKCIVKRPSLQHCVLGLGLSTSQVPGTCCKWLCCTRGFFGELKKQYWSFMFLRLFFLASFIHIHRPLLYLCLQFTLLLRVLPSPVLISTFPRFTPQLRNLLSLQSRERRGLNYRQSTLVMKCLLQTITMNKRPFRWCQQGWR